MRTCAHVNSPIPASGPTTGWPRVPDGPDGGVDSGRLNQKGGERQAGAPRPCVAALGQTWPGLEFRQGAQPQRQLERVQHQLDVLMSGAGSADHGPASRSPQRKRRRQLRARSPMPGTGHLAAAGRGHDKVPNRQVRRPLTVIARHDRAPGQLDRNRPTTAQRWAVDRLQESCIPYTATLLFTPQGPRCQ